MKPEPQSHGSDCGKSQVGRSEPIIVRNDVAEMLEFIDTALNDVALSGAYRINMIALSSSTSEPRADAHSTSTLTSI